MAYGKKSSGKSSKKVAEETKRLFDLYKNKREHWELQAREDQEYRLGRQWTQEQEETLKSRGQAPIVVNRIHPAVETAKALLTANRPSFKVSPREDSDTKVANVLNQLLSYMYDISDGRTAVRSAVDDYYVTGLGYLMVHQNPLADDGKGEVMFKDIDPLDVYVDPNSRDVFFDDAENIIISRNFTKAQAIEMYPQYERAIKAAEGGYDTDAIITGKQDNHGVTFPGEIDTQEEDQFVRGYERYYKVDENMYRVFESYSGKEYRFDEETFAQFLETKVGALNGRYYEGDDIASATENFNKMKLEKLEHAQIIINRDIHKIRRASSFR